MFTGIITDITEIIDQKQTDGGLELVFARPKEWTDIQLGESIATNGVCLTIASLDDESYTCLLIPETLHVTTFGKNVPKKVNLERAMQVGDRLSGHIVQGHVDTMGTVVSVSKSDGYVITIKTEKQLMKYVAHKGSVTVNGVALTIASLDEDQFSVALVPHTLSRTTLGDLNSGDAVNLEFDTLAKYAEQLMNAKNKENL